MRVIVCDHIPIVTDWTSVTKESIAAHTTVHTTTVNTITNNSIETGLSDSKQLLMNKAVLQHSNVTAGKLLIICSKLLCVQYLPSAGLNPFSMQHITSATEVMFSSLFVCLFVCLLATLRKTTKHLRTTCLHRNRMSNSNESSGRRCGLTSTDQQLSRIRPNE